MWYPLKFREVLRHYSFGGRWIPEFFPKEGLPEDGVIAETWEVCDHGKDVSVVRNGPLAGRTLHELIEEHGEALLGERVMRATGGRFPLIMKFLDATYELGFQVHPSDDNVPQDSVEWCGKTEAWYLIDAEPDAVVHCGVKPGVSMPQLYEAIRDRREYEVMNAYPVRPGDMIFVPAGAVHACRGGILIYEIMQNCDLTYSFGSLRDGPGFDELGPEQRLELEAVSLEDDPDYRIAPVSLEVGCNMRTFALACRYFAVERLDLSGPFEDKCDGGKFLAFSCIGGGGMVKYEGGSEPFGRGETFLMPAATGGFVIEPGDEAHLIRSSVPDLRKDIIEPLLAEGIEPVRISALGGKGTFNDLASLVS